MKENTFSEITDIDNKLLRTILQLFKNPKKVIEDTSGRYTPPTRYAFTIVGLFLLLVFLEDYLYPSDLHTNEWRIPLREQNYIEKQGDIEENFLGIMFLMSFLPGILLASKLLFYNKGSFTYFYRITLYFTGQLSVLGVLIGIAVYFAEGDISIPILVLLACYVAYFYLSLSLNRWFLTLPKIVIIMAIGVFTFSSLSPLLKTFIETIIIRPNKEYSLNISSNDIFIGQQVLEGMEGIYEITDGPDNYFFIDELNYGFGALNKDHQLLWYESDFLGFNQKQEFLKIYDEPKHKTVLIFGDSIKEGKRKDFLLLYNYAGKRLAAYNFDKDLATQAFQIKEVDSLGFTITVPYPQEAREQYIFKEAYISSVDYKMVLKPSFSLSEPIYETYSLQNGDYIASIIQKPDWHYVEFEVARYDSSNNLKWRQTTYDKESPYDPRTAQLLSVDMRRNEIIAHYSLANDSTDFAYFYSIDMNTGEVNWGTKDLIPGDYTEYKQMLIDKDFIYVCGETHRDIVKSFWKPQYHIAMIAKINRKNGKLVSYKYFGDEGPGGHSRFSFMQQTKETIILYGHESESRYFEFGETESNTKRWVIDKKEI